MALVLAAGAASCTGFFIGKFIMQQQQQQQQQKQKQKQRPQPTPRVQNTMQNPRSVPLPIPVPRPRPRLISVPAPRPAPVPKCTLCGVSYQNKEVVVVLTCGHLQHKHCSEEWSHMFLTQGMKCHCKMCQHLETIDVMASVEIIAPVTDKDREEYPTSRVRLTQIVDVSKIVGGSGVSKTVDSRTEENLRAVYEQRERQVVNALHEQYQQAYRQTHAQLTQQLTEQLTEQLTQQLTQHLTPHLTEHLTPYVTQHLTQQLTAHFNESFEERYNEVVTQLMAGFDAKLMTEYQVMREQYDTAYNTVLRQAIENQRIYDALLSTPPTHVSASAPSSSLPVHESQHMSNEYTFY